MDFEGVPKLEDDAADIENGEVLPELTLERASEREEKRLDRFQGLRGKSRQLLAGILMMTSIGCGEKGSPEHVDQEPKGKRPAPTSFEPGPQEQRRPPRTVRRESKFGGYGVRTQSESLEADDRPGRAKVVRVKKFSGYGIKTETGYNRYGEVVYRKTPHGEERLIED